MRGSGTLLLALDGVPIGLVVEADTLEGWVRRYDTRTLDYSVLRGDLLPSGLVGLPSKTGSLAGFDAEAILVAEAEYRRRLAACPVVRAEGKVDFIGDTATDPDWMIAQRLAAVRIRHGLPIDVSVAHDTSGMVASVIERLAAQLRSGSMIAVNLGQSMTSDRLPLPDDSYQYLPTGRTSLTVDCESPELAKAYEAAKTEWARQHAELVPEYVRSLTEGKAKIVEETEATAALRVRSAEMRATLSRRQP